MILTGNVLGEGVGEPRSTVAVAGEELVEAEGVLALVDALDVKSEVVATHKESATERKKDRC